MTLSYIPAGIPDPVNLKMTQQKVVTRFPSVGTRNTLGGYIPFELYEDTYPAATGPCQITRNELPTLINDEAVWKYATLTGAACEQATRDSLTLQIKSRPIQPATSRQIALDPQAQTLEHYTYEETAVTRRLNELEDTAAVDLDTFDPSIFPTDPDDPLTEVANVTIEISELTAWAGAPNDTLGFKVVLETAIGQEASGSELRINVIDAPKDKSAVLGPGTQDPNNLRIGVIESRDGFKWQDEILSATIRCYWGAGSIFVTGNIKARQFGPEYRELSPIEYGI